MKTDKTARILPLVVAALAAAGLASGTALASAPKSAHPKNKFQALFPTALTNKIKYVIILYPENRSFDSLYGYFPGANGWANATNTTQYGQSSGTPLASLPPPNLNGISLIAQSTPPKADPRFPASMPNAPYNTVTNVLDNDVTGDLTHLFYLEQYQINNPAYTNIGAYFAGGYDPKNAGGPVLSKMSAWSSNPGLVLSYYDESGASEASIGKQFVFADNTFHSAFGGSFLNHQFLIAARAPVWGWNQPDTDAGGWNPFHGASKPAQTVLTTNGLGQVFPTAPGTDYGLGKTLSDNALSADPTLPGFAWSNANTNLSVSGTNYDFWGINTLRPLRGPAGGYAVPAGSPYLNVPANTNGYTVNLTAGSTLSDGSTSFSGALFPAPISSTAPSARLPLQTHDTIGDRLNSAGISWAWFSGGWNAAKSGKADFLFQFHHQPFAFFSNYALAQSPIYPPNGSTNAPTAGVDSTDPGGAPVGYGLGSANHLLDEDADFYRMLNDGTLPHVSFVKPIGEENSHPGYASVKRGQAWAANTINKIRNSPIWGNCVVFLCYDEHGGLFDHAVPPVVDRWGPGLRIPLLIASPYSKSGFVDHNQYETVSILSFLENLYNLSPLNTRDANALPPLAAFKGEPDLFVVGSHTAALNYWVPDYKNPSQYAVTSGALPNGLTLDPATGLITGTPGSAGITSVIITVNDLTSGLPSVTKYQVEFDIN
jgi:phospholipase C